MVRPALLLALMVSLASHAQTPGQPSTAGAQGGAVVTTVPRPPVTFKEFEALGRKVPVQGGESQRKAFEQEAARLGDAMVGRTISDRASFSSVSEAPRASGQPKAWNVLCGPTKDPDVRLAALVRTQSRKVADLTSGMDISFTGKVVAVRYDSTARMVVVVIEGTTVP